MTAGRGIRRFPPAAYVLAGGLVAGLLDITYACVFWALKADVPVRRILQSVASGLAGPRSAEGGAATAALGLFLQMLIATTMAAVYYALAARWPLLRRRPLLCGAVYGLFLYVAMNFVVVPLSAAPSSEFRWALWTTLSIVAHVVLVGIPCAGFARLALDARDSGPGARNPLPGAAAPV